MRDILDDPRSTFAQVTDHARQLLAIQDEIRRIVPPNVKVASIADKTLHLVTPSSAAATQIRYRQRTIITTLRKIASHLHVEQIQVSVRPEPEPQEPTTRPPVPPSEENARQLASTAKYIEHDPLRKALMRLSMRGSESG